MLISKIVFQVLVLAISAVGIPILYKEMVMGPREAGLPENVAGFWYSTGIIAVLNVVAGLVFWIFL